jgi:hypothetical protein
VHNKIAEQLHASIRELNLFDAPLCVCYASVIEDGILDTPALADLHRIKQVFKISYFHIFRFSNFKIYKAAAIEDGILDTRPRWPTSTASSRSAFHKAASHLTPGRIHQASHQPRQRHTRQHHTRLVSITLLAIPLQGISTVLGAHRLRQGLSDAVSDK